MPPELPTNELDDLIAHHRRGSSVAQRRILLLALGAAVATVAVLALAIDMTRTSPARRYASAVSWERKTAPNCDGALGRRRFWIGPVVASTDMCVAHTDTSALRVLPNTNLSFLVLGDWGRDGMCCQRDVAEEMALAADKLHPAFVVSVGDNFYNDGISRSNDLQVQRSWRGVYIDPYENMSSLQWKVILGNHDYQGSSDAQIVLSKKDALWHFPKPYYFETTANGDVFMAFIDTTVMYYTQAELEHFQDDKLTTFYRDEQVAELRKELAKSNAKWKLVFGHHPLYSSGENARTEGQNLKQMQTMLLHLLRDNNVAAYFSGHEHTLEHLRSSGVNFFISGGGSKTSPLEFNNEELVFAMGQQGFMAVSVLNDPEELHVQVVGIDGSIVYSARVEKPEAAAAPGSERRAAY